ncbi:hypothetical protein [Actinacidiphila sp. bgisy145]
MSKKGGSQKPAPVGDAMHSPKAKEVRIYADPNGNRQERREAARQDRRKK